jgi:glyoxylase-like metal-dependent hydrolase (beta-lactamase superfamily II)
MTALPPWATLVRADNPSPMTLEGTNTYVLRAAGAESCVVVDPGPLDPAHLEAVAAYGPVGLVLLTHGHPDHAEGAGAFADLVGAPVAAADGRLASDRSDVLRGGARLSGVGGLDIEVVATPGHTSDSLCFVVEEAESAILTGDTILGRGTTVVAHPDGRLADYLDSLRTIERLGGARSLTLLPGHGPTGGPAGERATAYLAHREQRLAQVRSALAGGARTPREVVEVVYADVDRDLWDAAEQSVRAQLDYLKSTPPDSPLTT